MTARKGFALVLVIFLIAIAAVGGVAGTALLGQAPKCPSGPGAARTEKEIGDLLEKTGAITTTDPEATAIAQNYVAGKVDDARVCFTPGLAHASGNIKLGPATPSFYASAGIDLSGTSPKATNLDIKVGSLPDIPVLSGQVEGFVTSLINENLAKVTLKKKYSVNFSTAAATVTKLTN